MSAHGTRIRVSAHWSGDLSRSQHVPAAAAASTGDFFVSEGSSLGRGLRSLPSERRAGGDRERLSNLEARLGSGSVWSKRDRLGRFSGFSMMSPRDKKGDTSRLQAFGYDGRTHDYEMAGSCSKARVGVVSLAAGEKAVGCKAERRDGSRRALIAASWMEILELWKNKGTKYFGTRRMTAAVQVAVN